MKIKFLMIGLLGLISTTALAQKGALKDAQESYTNYTIESGQKVLAAKAATDINDAKTAIDKAAGNDKTAAMAETYALKGAIYSALASRDSVASTAAPLLTTAQDAIKKAVETDTKGEFKKLIADANNNLAIYYSKLGVSQYQNKKYDLAYQSFDSWAQATNDTTALYYAALAASNAGATNPKFYSFAITNYGKLLATNYSENAKIYGYQAILYITAKDIADALKTINAGVAKYPTNTTLQEDRVRFYLQANKENEILTALEGAVANDPKNKTLDYYAALTYSRIGDATEDKAKKAKDDASRASLNKTALDSYAKAADYYKKALEIDPDYFEANLNLGYVLMRPAVDLYNQATNLPTTATQKQYDDLRLKADVQFDIARPYLQKALDLNPKSAEALNNMRNYYRGKYDPAHANENKAKAEDLKKQVDALPPASAQQ